MTKCVMTSLTSVRRQSNTAAALVSTGAPVTSLVHSALVNLSSRYRPVRPAKIFARSSCAGVRVFMQNTPFSIILAAEGEDLLMQNNIMGGSTVIDATEVAVIPPRPAGPPV